MAWKPLDKFMEIPAQSLTAPERTGFTAVEWAAAGCVDCFSAVPGFFLRNWPKIVKNQRDFFQKSPKRPCNLL